jgi:hypothetical protein
LRAVASTPLLVATPAKTTCAAPAQDLFERGAVEGADLLLGHSVIARLAIELGNELRPTGRRGEVQLHFGAAGSAAGDVDQNHRQAARAEGARELRRTADDLVRGVRARQTDNALQPYQSGRWTNDFMRLGVEPGSPGNIGGNEIETSHAVRRRKLSTMNSATKRAEMGVPPISPAGGRAECIIGR